MIAVHSPVQHGPLHRAQAAESSREAAALKPAAVEPSQCLASLVAAAGHDRQPHDKHGPGRRAVDAAVLRVPSATGSTGSCSGGRNTPSKSRYTSSWKRCDSSSARVDVSRSDECSIVDSLVKAPFPSASRIVPYRPIRYCRSMALLAATASRCLCVVASASAGGNTPAAVVANDDDDDDDDDDEAGAAHDEEDEDAAADGDASRKASTNSL